MSGLAVALPRLRVRRRRRRPRRPNRTDIARLVISAAFGGVGIVGAMVGAPAGASVCWAACGLGVRLAARAWNRPLLTVRESAELFAIEVLWAVGVSLISWRM